MNGAQISSGAQLMDSFMAADAERAAGRLRCVELREEHAELMRDWAALVASHDFEAIAARAMRLGEIKRELLRLGG